MNSDQLSAVLRLFGAYKAEWLNGQLFHLFRKPQYFAQLSEATPCVLIGGRGTGKTTVLKGLSYQGQFALLGSDPAKISELKFFGLYQRVNTNRVTAFCGSELNEEKWAKSFAHYMNLSFCGELLELCNWLETTGGCSIKLDKSSLAEICASLQLEQVDSHEGLRQSVRLAQASFEATINNIGSAEPTGLSVAGAPLDLLTAALARSAVFAGRPFYFLIDEFENFVDYQQRVLNTFIKHASTTYTFKIGVRELGWRDRRTANLTELLRHPADYFRISIDEYMDSKRFEEFAREVCEGRLNGGSEHCLSIEDLLPALSPDDEVQLLGARPVIDSTRKAILEKASSDQSEFVSAMSPSRLYFLSYWAKANSRTIWDEFQRAYSEKARWDQDFNNHGYASLFAIKRGKRGIRKHYAGWDVFTRLANGNIRFLLELVHSGLTSHIEQQNTLRAPVSFETQTLAAQRVARQNLGELEGLSIEGARLTKLVLSLGRVFQVLAEQPAGHTPEVTQFEIDWEGIESPEDERALDQFLRQAVQHLALVRIPGTKPTDASDTKDYDYMLHPIFAALFSYSHRRKRKMKLSAAQFWGLISTPGTTISEILSQTNRVTDSDLPDQLQLFDQYYARRS